MSEEYSKSLDDYFADWEAYAFGFGYGTGEEHTVPAVKLFFELCPASKAYDYRDLENGLGATVAWLLINRLAAIDILEYGTSPRCAWLTKEGKALKAFVDEHSADELIKLTERDQNYVGCYPDACNCGPNGYDEKRICQNPFWKGYRRNQR